MTEARGREGANEREQRLFVNSDKNSDRLMTHPSDSESETAVAAALTGNCFETKCTACYSQRYKWVGGLQNCARSQEGREGLEGGKQ